MKTTLILSVAVCLAIASTAAASELETVFRSPPDAAKAWCYWWWLNGAASKEGITRDFEEMKKEGIAGALLFGAGGRRDFRRQSDRGNDQDRQERNARA
jgi:hypothetical protein